MPLPRLRLRTLMIAVAVAAVLLALGIEGGRLCRVSWQRWRTATLLALEEQRIRSNVERQASLLRTVAAQLEVAKPADRDALGRKIEELRAEAEEMEPKLNHAAALRHKAERAAWRPWLPVPPDPPPPK